MRFNYGHLALLLTAVLFGLAFIFQRHGAQFVNPLWFTAWRFLLAAVTLSVIWLAQHYMYPLAHYGRWGFYGAVSGILMFGGMIAQQWGLGYTTAGKSGFLTGLYIILIPIILALFGQKMSRHTIVAVGFACIGLWCFMGVSADNAILLWNIGDYVTLLGTFFWSLQVIWMGIAVRHANVLAFSAMQLWTVALLAVIGVCVIEGVEAFLDWSALNITFWDIAYTGLGSSALAFFLQAIGQRKVSASAAAILLSMEAVFALGFGWWLLDEQITPLMLSGCAMMFIAMLIAQSEPSVS